MPQKIQQKIIENWSVSLIQSIIRRMTFKPLRPTNPANPAIDPLIDPPSTPPSDPPPIDSPSDPWRGNPNLGKPIAAGKHPRQTHGNNNLNNLNHNWHDFTWLRDMREYGGRHSRTLARRFILEWIDQNLNWTQNIWHPQRISTRLKNLVLTWQWYGDSANTAQQNRIIAAINGHKYALNKDWKSLKKNNNQLDALSSLIIANTFLKQTHEAHILLEQFINHHLKRMLGDGTHISRQPDLHFNMLKILIETRIGSAPLMTQNIHKNNRKILDDSIAQMAAIGRMWHHSTGKLINILGSLETDTQIAQACLSRTETKNLVTTHAKESGFIRIANGRSVMIMNTAPEAKALTEILNQGGQADAGALAFEFSNGNNIIIVNAGQAKNPAQYLTPEISQALASTAAFSTLAIDNINSAELNKKQQKNSKTRYATALEAETGPAPGGMLLEAKHDGYEKSHGLIHQRRVFLATGGNDLRGEDSLIYNGAPGLIPHEASIRFHLHPQINAARMQGGEVLLRLPGKAADWIFKAATSQTYLEESVMLSEDGLEKSTQIRLTMPLASIREQRQQSIKWALRRQTHKT